MLWTETKVEILLVRGVDLSNNCRKNAVVNEDGLKNCMRDMVIRFYYLWFSL